MKTNAAHQEKSREEFIEIISQQSKQIDSLNELLRLYHHRQFGKKSEKFINPDQMSFFDEPELPKKPEPILKADEEITIASHTRKKTSGRKALPAELPREKRIYDLKEEDKKCACGCDLTHIKDEISEQLDIVPAKIVVIQHVRKKYACKSCEETIKTASLPAPQPIPKSIASPGLLSHVLVSKYEDHRPLHRQENMLRRIGVDIPRSTLSLWVIRVAKLVKPLMAMMRKIILNYDVSYSDETTIQVLKENNKPVQSKKYIWLFSGGAPNQFCFYYRYHHSRSSDVLLDFFDGYKGYIHCDGYTGYDALAARVIGITLSGCMYHTRRKFVEMLNVSKAKEGVAHDAVSMIAKLANIEEEIKEKDREEKCRVRMEQSKPLLDELHDYLTQSYSRTLPKSPLGQAIFYTLNQWKKLLVYLEDGRLENNNNRSERAIKPFVMGRKGWLFSDRVEGAEASSIIFSLVETCKHHDVDSYKWFRYVLEKIPLCQSEDEIEKLLPFNIDQSLLV